jgi:hypothetical protein
MPSAAKKVNEASDRSAEAPPRLSAVTGRGHARLMQRADALATALGRFASAGGTGGRQQSHCALRSQHWQQGNILGGRR